MARVGNPGDVGTGPAPAWLAALLEPVYRRVIDARNRRFDSGKGVVRFDRPCISIGNLSVGGTGKTPMVARVCRWLDEDGHRPVIAMRGYRSKNTLSDEAVEYARTAPNARVVADPNRVDALLDFFNDEEISSDPRTDCIVLDDGFQHRRIARDLDIVLIDATRNVFRDRLLPRGWLREPVQSLARASAVVITHAESVTLAALNELRHELAAVFPGEPAIARHEWSSLRIAEGPGERREAVEWLRGRGCVAVCGIGNPAPFLAACDAAARVTDRIIMADHAPFTPAVLARLHALSASGDLILTTEKDWSRLGPGWRGGAVARPELTLAFDRGEGELREAVRRAASARID